MNVSLEEALAQFDVELPASQVDQLRAYCGALWQWNEKLNLTRHTDFETFVSRDLNDSIQLSRRLTEGVRILDFGTGGGVPGVVMKIIRPELDISLCESVGKKAIALTDILNHIKLDAPVYNGRAEALIEDEPFHTLTARAVGPMWKICKWFESRTYAFDQVLLIKGPRWVQEQEEAV